MAYASPRNDSHENCFVLIIHRKMVWSLCGIWTNLRITMKRVRLEVNCWSFKLSLLLQVIIMGPLSWNVYQFWILYQGPRYIFKNSFDHIVKFTWYWVNSPGIGFYSNMNFSTSIFCNAIVSSFQLRYQINTAFLLSRLPLSRRVLGKNRTIYSSDQSQYCSRS